jgi:membrane associated rhomboid family serine protease
MAWVKFLIVAVIAMAICLGGLGGWLLPSLDFEPSTSRFIGGAVGGMIVALLYVRMKPGQTA